MRGEAIFVDTSFILALINTRDALHASALLLVPRVTSAARLITSDAVLVEVCNGLSRSDRQAAADFVRTCFGDPQFDVVASQGEFLEEALSLYETSSDKQWGLTDCISFVVMRERGLMLAATADHHFRQAGFLPLLED